MNPSSSDGYPCHYHPAVPDSVFKWVLRLVIITGKVHRDEGYGVLGVFVLAKETQNQKGTRAWIRILSFCQNAGGLGHAYVKDGME